MGVIHTGLLKKTSGSRGPRCAYLLPTLGDPLVFLILVTLGMSIPVFIMCSIWMVIDGVTDMILSRVKKKRSC